MTIHYPKRVSKIKRVRQCGFEPMKTKSGRKILNARRRIDAVGSTTISAVGRTPEATHHSYERPSHRPTSWVIPNPL